MWIFAMRTVQTSKSTPSSATLRKWWYLLERNWPDSMGSSSRYANLLIVHLFVSCFLWPLTLLHCRHYGTIWYIIYGAKETLVSWSHSHIYLYTLPHGQYYHWWQQHSIRNKTESIYFKCFRKWALFPLLLLLLSFETHEFDRCDVIKTTFVTNCNVTVK